MTSQNHRHCHLMICAWVAFSKYFVCYVLQNDLLTTYSISKSKPFSHPPLIMNRPHYLCFMLFPNFATDDITLTKCKENFITSLYIYLLKAPVGSTFGIKIYSILLFSLLTSHSICKMSYVAYSVLSEKCLPLSFFGKWNVLWTLTGF